MSVSRSSHYTPRSSASHGRIVTQNSSLSAALLREKSNGVVAGSDNKPVDSTALNVVPSDVNVPNVVSKPADNTSVQYIAVSKSRLSLDHASNTGSQLPADDSVSINADTDRVNDNHSTSHLEEEEQTIQASQVKDSIEHHRYAYRSLKRSSRASSYNADEDLLGIKTATKSSLKGDGVVINKEFGEKTDSKSFVITSDTNNTSGIGTGERTVSNANNNAHLNSRASSFAQSNRSIAQGNQGTLAEPQSSTQQSGHEHQHRLDAHQHTRLSLVSQHDRVSRDREPFQIDPAVQSVPPLDLTCLTPDKAPSDFSDSDSDIPISSQTQLQVQFSDQNLHASDRNTSILHFSAHDLNQTTSGRKTYEVENPLVSSKLPHVKSSNNFSGEPDTYRQEREADPQSLQEIHGVEVARSDLADDLNLPYQFDTQAGTNQVSAGPPSPPIQTTPPPPPEPATSLHSKNNSTVYAVANPNVLRAQGISPPPGGQYISNPSRRSDHGEVRFDSASRQPRPETDSRSPIKDRAPTPYAHTPPADSEREPSGGKRKGSSAKSTLPPQHPPLDTKHNTPKPGASRKNSVSTVKRVYVESPSFTREEEEEYRFVNSRLDDIDEKDKTYRDMDSKQRGYGGDDMGYSQGYQQGDNRSHPSSKKTAMSRPKQEQDRYEDRDPDKYDRKGRDRYENDKRERYENNNRDRYEDTDRDRYDDRNHDRYEDTDRDRYENRNRERYDDRNHEMNGYSDSRYKHKEEDRYEDRDRYERNNYDQQDRYEQLQNERAVYERELNREPDPDLNRFPKQNTEVIDQQDLRKESEYQQDLKKRIDKQEVRDRDSYINSLRHRDAYEKDNFVQDSLEYPEEGEARQGYPRDSVEYGNYQEWENPPQNQYQNNPYSENQQFEKQSSKPDFYDAEDVARMELVNPKMPKYDYVEHNKEDYGMPPKQTYRSLVHKKHEEQEKLEHVFITPKVPPKPGKKKPKKALSAQPVHMGHQAPVHDRYPLGFKPSSAEELWAQKAASLHTRKESAGGSKHPKGSANKPTNWKWNSNPKVDHPLTFKAPPPIANQGGMYRPIGQPGSREQGHTTPTRPLQPLENKPAPPTSTELVPTAVQPNSPFRRHLELKPISQEITTEDGQRISVDINLRLISPPPQHSGPVSPTQQQLSLVPVQETQGQYADDGARGIGVPYQMQDPYSGYDIGYNNAFNEQDLTHSLPISDVEQQITAEELAIADPTGYSKRYQTGSPRNDDMYTADSVSTKKDEEGSYAAQYHRHKNKELDSEPWYKVYNLTDYKKMQREIRLNRGTLGPDLDTENYKEKLEKKHRQSEYAKNVKEKNRMELTGKKPPSFPRQPQKPGEDNVKRKTALDYARTVPKPQVKPRPNQYNSYEVSAQLAHAGGALKSPSSHSKVTSPPTTVDVIDIRTLEQRHLAEKKNADKIRQNMDSVLSQKAH